jgi:hypothetical protein
LPMSISTVFFVFFPLGLLDLEDMVRVEGGQVQVELSHFPHMTHHTYGQNTKEHHQ